MLLSKLTSVLRWTSLSKFVTMEVRDTLSVSGRIFSFRMGVDLVPVPHVVGLAATPHRCALPAAHEVVGRQ